MIRSSDTKSVFLVTVTMLFYFLYNLIRANALTIGIFLFYDYVYLS